MRVIAICAVMFLSYGCLAQTASQISNQTPNYDLADGPLLGPGEYAMPFVPLIATPTAQLPEPKLQVGASDATGPNMAGAQDSTLSALPQNVDPLLIAPRLTGAPISYDIYPRTDNGKSH